MTSGPKKVSRRKFIGYGIGGAVAIAAVGSAAYYATRSPSASTTATTASPTTTTAVTTTTPEATTTTPTVSGVQLKMAATAGYDLSLMQKFLPSGVTLNATSMAYDTAKSQQLLDISSKSASYDIYLWDNIWTGFFAPSVVPYSELKSAYPDVWQEAQAWWDENDYIGSDARYAHWQDLGRVGNVYAANCMLYVYRKDLFTDSSLQSGFKSKYGYEFPDPSSKVLSLQELHDTTEFFTQSDATGKVLNPNSPTKTGICWFAADRDHSVYWAFLPVFAAFRMTPEAIAELGQPPATPYGTYFTADKKIAVNSKWGIQALEFYKKMTQLELAPYSSNDAANFGYFGDGLAASSWTWSVFPVLYSSPKDYPKIQGKFAPAYLPGGWPNDGTWQLGVSKLSKNKKEAFRFILLTQRPDVMIYNWEQTGAVPCRNSVFKSALANPNTKYKDMLAISQNSLNGSGFPGLQGTSYRMSVPQEVTYESQFSLIMSTYFAGQLTSDQAAKKLADAWDTIVSSSS